MRCGVNNPISQMNKPSHIIKRLLQLLLVVFSLTGWLPAHADNSDNSLLSGAESGDVVEELPFEFMNRYIFTMRSESMGFNPKERQITIRNRIKTAMEIGGEDTITIRHTPEGGRFVELNGMAVFQIRPADLDPLLDDSIDSAVKAASENLKKAVAEARQQSKPKVLLEGIGYSLVASILFYLAYRLIYWGEQRLINRLQIWLSRYKARLVVALQPQLVINGMMSLVHIAKWVLVLVVVYEWASFVLRQFPYSRPWGERLQGYLIETVEGILSSIVDALPGLLVVFLIVMLTRFASEMLRAFFARIESGKVSVSWMAEDTARPTRKLAQAMLWLFALAMAYPYLPGSNTEAFKGLSVLIGIMVSIGGSGVVGQAASGLIMIYSHVLREGEYVKIDDIEGLVSNVGIFSTKVRTSNGEEVNIPNSLIGSSKTINSSRLAEGNGLVVHTTVTIGYNTPWRQVHAMLLRAAEKTNGLRTEPQPFISQTALSDFYVEYRLSAQIERADMRRITLTALHANIQDEFNEFGVQIMSPHYVGDPAEKVWSPKQQWFEAPADMKDDSRPS
jgi:small-conductance mechanosensitive channel